MEYMIYRYVTRGNRVMTVADNFVHEQCMGGYSRLVHSLIKAVKEGRRRVHPGGAPSNG